MDGKMKVIVSLDSGCDNAEGANPSHNGGVFQVVPRRGISGGRGIRYNVRRADLRRCIQIETDDIYIESLLPELEWAILALASGLVTEPIEVDV